MHVQAPAAAETSWLLPRVGNQHAQRVNEVTLVACAHMQSQTCPGQAARRQQCNSTVISECCVHPRDALYACSGHMSHVCSGHKSRDLHERTNLADRAEDIVIPPESLSAFKQPRTRTNNVLSLYQSSDFVTVAFWSIENTSIHTLWAPEAWGGTWKRRLHVEGRGSAGLGERSDVVREQEARAAAARAAAACRLLPLRGSV